MNRELEEYLEPPRFVVSAPRHSSVLRLAVPAIRPSSGTSTIYTLLISNFFFHIVQLLIFLCYNISFIALLPKKDSEHARFNVHETVTTVSV